MKIDEVRTYIYYRGTSMAFARRMKIISGEKIFISLLIKNFAIKLKAPYHTGQGADQLCFSEPSIPIMISQRRHCRGLLTQ